MHFLYICEHIQSSALEKEDEDLWHLPIDEEVGSNNYNLD